MKNDALRFVFCGLSITSSWGNGHATTYRALLRALAGLGHEVLFLEFDKPWYAGNRDLPAPPYCRTELFASVTEFKDRFTADLRDADVVVLGSFVPEGIEIGQWILLNANGITAFYDIDTPVTLSLLDQGNNPYLALEQIPLFQVYLSFTGGPVLEVLQRKYHSPRARALYCSVDTDAYCPADRLSRWDWDLGYLGTYSEDRQPALERLLIEPARRAKAARFVVAGPMYPESIQWGENVTRVQHLPPGEHRRFYSAQRFTLNVTRKQMVQAGYSPSVRLFEAAACGTPIITDFWPGLDRFFRWGKEILLAQRSEDVEWYLKELGEEERIAIGRRARERVLARHSSRHRAEELCHIIEQMRTQATLARFGERRVGALHH